MLPLSTTARFPFAVASSTQGTQQAALLAILSTCLGTAMAIHLLPQNPSRDGALFASAVALCTGLAVAPIKALLHHPKAILRGEHLLSIAPIYWLLLDLIQGLYSMEMIERVQIQRAFVAIGLFVVMVWVGALRRPWPIPAIVIKAASQEFSLTSYFGLAVVSFSLGMLNFAVACNFNVAEMFYYVGQERWAAPWGRGQLGGWDAFLDHLQYFGYLLPVLTIVVQRYAGWLNMRTIICVAMSAVMILFLAQSGSRRVIGVVIGMALILWILGQQRLRIKHVIQTTVAIAALLLALQVMLEYRNVGLGTLLGFRTEASHTASYREHFFREQHLRVDDNFFRLCQVIQLIPSSHPFVYHQYILYVLVRPIPRVFWADKPIDPGFDLPTALGVEGVSYSYSVIGELYMSFGFIGIAFGGWFYGRLSAMARGMLSRTHTLSGLVMYSILVMALFSGMRSILELILVSYVILAWIGLSKLFRLIGAAR